MSSKKYKSCIENVQLFDVYLLVLVVYFNQYAFVYNINRQYVFDLKLIYFNISF